MQPGLLINATMADLSKEFDLIILFITFNQSNSNSSLKFGQLTAKWLKSLVLDLQIKHRASVQLVVEDTLSGQDTIQKPVLLLHTLSCS